MAVAAILVLSIGEAEYDNDDDEKDMVVVVVYCVTSFTAAEVVVEEEAEVPPPAPADELGPKADTMSGSELADVLDNPELRSG